MPASPSIAILVSGRHVANRERMFFRIADELRQRGAQVEFLAAGPEAEFTAALPAAYPLHNISALPNRVAGTGLPHGWRLASAILPLASYLRRRKTEVLFTTSIPPNLVGSLARMLAGGQTRLVLRQSNTLRRPGAGFEGVERRWRDRLIKPLYAGADRIVANSEGVASNLLSLGLSGARMTVIPNGIDFGWITAQSLQPAPLPPAGYGVRTIVAIGRLVAQKDHATLLHALARLRGVPLCRLLILGDGPERGRLTHLAQSLGIAGQVHLPGFFANPFPILSGADLFVLSSRHEGMPNALLEALACGLPVVATDCPSGPRELLAEGAFGDLVPVGDARAMADSIARTLTSPPPRERQIARARHYDADAIAAHYADLILGAAQPREAAALALA